MLFFLLKGKQIAELNVNEEIRSKKLLVIAPDGVQVGELELKKALILAEELDLDLVEVSPESKPPVARLMDYGKYKFELKQKARESRKKQVKTVRFEKSFLEFFGIMVDLKLFQMHKTSNDLHLTLE